MTHISEHSIQFEINDFLQFVVFGKSKPCLKNFFQSQLAPVINKGLFIIH